MAARTSAREASGPDRAWCRARKVQRCSDDTGRPPHARSHVAHAAAQILGIDGAVLEFRVRRERLGSPVAVPGMLKIIQCRTSSVLRCSATSGSCRINAKLTVPAGTWVHSSFGETAFGIGLRVFVRNDAAVFKIGRSEREAGRRADVPLWLRKGRAEARHEEHRCSYSEYSHEVFLLGMYQHIRKVKQIVALALWSTYISPVMRRW